MISMPLHRAPSYAAAIQDGASGGLAPSLSWTRWATELPLLLRRTALALAALALLLVLAEAASLTPTSPESAPAPASEYDQKARVVVTMARLARWSDNALGGPVTPFQLCILGKDPFGTAWQPYERGTVHGRPFRTRRIAGLDEVEGCAVVFIARSESTRLQRYLQGLAGMHVLTVSEIEGFVEAGGHLELLTTEDRVAFNLNRDRGYPSADPYLPTNVIPARNFEKLRK